MDSKETQTKPEGVVISFWRWASELFSEKMEMEVDFVEEGTQTPSVDDEWNAGVEYVQGMIWTDDGEEELLKPCIYENFVEYEESESECDEETERDSDSSYTTISSEVFEKELDKERFTPHEFKAIFDLIDEEIKKEQYLEDYKELSLSDMEDFEEEEDEVEKRVEIQPQVETSYETNMTEPDHQTGRQEIPQIVVNVNVNVNNNLLFANINPTTGNSSKSLEN